MSLGRTTKLQAVNTALTSSQLSPVESLSSGDLDAEQAEQILDEVTVEVQTKSWYWNTRKIEVSPDVSGNIFLEDNLLLVDAFDPTIHVVQQGNRLYNLTDNTFKFKKKIELIKVFAFDFEELPQTCRRYITLKTSRLLQDRIIGDAGLSNSIQLEERLAFNKMKAEQVKVSDYNMIRGNATSSYILDRFEPSRGRLARTILRR